MYKTYDTEVAKRFTIYNSLFLDLPFDHIFRTGTMLPLLGTACQKGFESEKTPREIIEGFFEEMMPSNSEKERTDLLFQMIQYVERQVVLFDSIEDAAYEKINDLGGKGSIKALINRAESDHKKEALIEKLKSFSVRLTLTAHPTQFYPGNVLGIITDLENAIRQDDIGRINQLLQQLGKTGFINREKPSPYEEAVSLIWFLENVFYQSISDIMIRMLNRLNIPLHDWENPGLLKVGFWPGGDRDGNPFVTHETTMQVAERLKKWILRCYYRDVRKLRRRLTFKHVENVILKVEKGIYSTLFEDQPVYSNKEELLADLLNAREALIEHHDGLFLELLDEFILKVRIFGFHFAYMDMRQDSRKHDALWEEIFEVKGIEWKATEEEQIQQLLAVDSLPEIERIQDEFHQEMLKSFGTIEKIHESNGEDVLHRYIISNCQSAKHLLEVFQLAKLTLGKGKENLPLDVVPLFETIDDLAEAPEIMTYLYRLPAYQKHLASRGNKQTIMLGFSDGTKDGGYLKANWSILRAKEEMTRVSRENGIEVVFFDGRGGPPARGGGNMHNFYASLGERVENAEIQVTIQGQTISANYGKQASCTYNFEQLLSAGLENHLYSDSERNLSEDQRALIEELANRGYESYKAFKNHPKFVPYLEHVTPLKYFGMTNIGSRPLKRGKGEGLKFEDLRAIPFVGSWAQMKQNIPGYYGVGAAIAEMEKENRVDELKELYQNSLFFRTLLGNSMQSLNKCFYPATSYLKNNEEYGGFWKLMFQEYERSVEKLKKVSQMEELMGDNKVIKTSIAIRERIVLPLITIQQYAIQSMLEDGKSNEVLQRLILRSMFGIINAARNAA
ncbi:MULTISPECIES: phosphoenolpyruvate carboxylase [Algoriphagus]|uniref:phosphoenolpyruvate carboxylase n=4 Tax=Cyclobacteriaceae TaxID=563798 RepID=UPI000C354CD5|nr:MULTISPECIES: phosphoenolpyruvate carboxylase [Algoriphagus]MAL15231.1 phosphoenolpyruvate carboxylase [Algoriphagus sp.]QYH37857.1 phosphoenolpyruvate carboxylase [Algoriphagus sp. NBT04N3]HAS58095.1 phosphoenolpyruvate carboxylase [Algoriphagus sp.]